MTGKEINVQDKFMKSAIKRAKTAASHGETPIGAVIVKDGKIIASGRNRREEKKNALCHAEISAIDKACKKLGGWRLCGCDIYVTLEPCAMCAGAIINSRIENVYFGAYDKKAGSFGTLCDFNSFGYNHKPGVYGGILEKECSELLSDFFKSLRKSKEK
ncbi:MAG: nucleoside deaminase [Clostridia bacterium]|nr:nucleoside deaminase [Clostridia bacterium]